MDFGIRLLKRGLERDKVNARRLKGKVYLGGRDPFYNINLSYGHEDFRIER